MHINKSTILTTQAPVITKNSVVSTALTDIDKNPNKTANNPAISTDKAAILSPPLISSETQKTLVQLQEGISGSNSSTVQKTHKVTLPRQEIDAKYDLRNISPEEIDAYAKELHENGHFGEESLMLLTYGAEFQTHLAKAISEVTGVKTSVNTTDKIDVIAKMENNLKISRSFGHPTEFMERQIAYLKSITDQTKT